VDSQFHRLTRGDARIDDELRGFLGRAYNLKATVDYETGPGSFVSREQAEAALATAGRFVDAVAALLADPP
jgi:uncharacterized protein (UPF0332 family)